MEQPINSTVVRNYHKLIADPIRSMLQTFETLGDEDPFSAKSGPDLYDPSRIPCLAFEALNKCADRECGFFHGQRCPHCCENVLPVWNAALRDQHTSSCRLRIQELRRLKRYELQPAAAASWLQLARNEDERRNCLLKNQQWC